jgi:hypothetical protein
MAKAGGKKSPSRNQGGDRGKGPNKTGTLPKKRREAVAEKPGRKDVKGGPKRGAAGSKHAAAKARGQKTGATRKAGPRKTPRGTTRRSGEK